MTFSYILFVTILHVFVPGQVHSEGIFSPIQAVCILKDPLNIYIPYDDSKVRYLLWTKDNTGDDEYENLLPFDDPGLQSSLFDGSRKTYTLIPGFTDIGLKQWILDAKKKILVDVGEDANVFSLDYGELVKSVTTDAVDYLPAVCNAYKVANYTAYVFNWLKEKGGLDRSRVHLIGHSLGAHVAGVAAYYMFNDPKLTIGKISRITGLDPAGPLFGKTYLNNFKLNKTQADYVDIIHTNGCNVPEIVCRGIEEECGHVDFFPNGGIIQPGCGIIFDQCSHQRVTALYVESIKPIDKTFKSWPCDSYENYKDDKCTKCGDNDDKCLVMGYYVTTTQEGTYYLTTNDVSPYAKGDVQ